MKSALLLAALITASAGFSLSASAQVATEVVSPGATVTTPAGSTVTTIVQTPSDTTTTKVTSFAPQSQIFKLKDGRRMEVDSDNSAYIVFDDGARVTAPDGVHTLLGGATVTVKDGHRIP